MTVFSDESFGFNLACLLVEFLRLHVANKTCESFVVLIFFIILWSTGSPCCVKL